MTAAATLAPRWKGVYDCTAEALRDVLRDAQCRSVDAGPAPQPHHSDDMQAFLAAVALVQSAAEAALADNSLAWNALEQRDLIQRLPARLVHMCFELLDFSERITVSHVSRGWREVALSDARLWNVAAPPPQAQAIGADMLAELLMRSDPLPFSFTWVGTMGTRSIPVDTFEVVLRNMHRMRELNIEHLSAQHVERLFEQRSPLLVRFICDTYPRFTLPARWAVDHAPLLEELELDIGDVPPDLKPFALVQSFRCDELDGFQKAGLDLFRIFPQLRSLRVKFMALQALPCLYNPPASLTHLALETLAKLEPIDYSPLLEVCQAQGIHFRRLVLESATAFEGALELFMRDVQGTWRLEQDRNKYSSREGRTSITFASNTEDIVYTVRCWRAVSLSGVLSSGAHIDRISHLAIGLPVLKEMGGLGSWSRSLPALCSLEVLLMEKEDEDRDSDGSSDGSESRDGSVSGDGAQPPPSPPSPLPPAPLPVATPLPPISAPLLENVVVWIDRFLPAHDSWTASELSELLPSLFARARPRLATLTIDAWEPKFPKKDINPLLTFAELVLVKNRRTQHTLEYVPPKPV